MSKPLYLDIEDMMLCTRKVYSRNRYILVGCLQVNLELTVYFKILLLIKQLVEHL